MKAEGKHIEPNGRCVKPHPLPIEERIDRLPWSDLQQSLADAGYSVTPEVLTPEECVELRNLYEQDQLFGNNVVLQVNIKVPNRESLSRSPP